MKRIKGFQRYLIIGFISIFFIACGSTQPLKKPILIINKHPSSQQSSAILQAGVARADITPPPGMPMAGHSTLSCSGKGVRNKLKARAIYIKPVNGKPVALVQVDLLAGSRIVHHKVAELVAEETGIEAGGLLIAGTHTHCAPGNYFGNNFYNFFASNKKGFEEKYFEFLSKQIAWAVKQAYFSRRPAKIATGSIDIKGVTLNRSFRAYLRNHNIKDKDKLEKFDAINPTLHLIRIDCLDNDGIYKPIGAFSNFSIHPNSPPGELEQLYNADVSAYIERTFASEIKRIYNPPWEPVHAAANYTQGDNNPFYGDKIIESFWDFERVGSYISAMALQCFRELDRKLTDDIKIRFAAKEIDMFIENSIAGIKVAKKPKVGCPTLGGAQGRGRTSPLAYLPFIAPGWPRWIFTGGVQGHKRVFLGPLQSLVFPKKNFPHHIFFQVIQVHDAVFLAVPWEVTFELGKRISGYAQEQGILAGLNNGNRYIVVSCSNGLCAYVTTEEEYTLQYFEGGFNLYGPNTGKFIKFHMGDLVKGIANEETDSDLPDKWEFNHLRAADFYPKEKPYKGNREIHRAPGFHQGEFREEPYWSFEWVDVPPHLINLHQDLVSIDVQNDDQTWAPVILDGKAVNDNGSNISIHYLKKISKKCKEKEKRLKNMGLYQARWYNPPGPDGKCYRFVIQPRANQEKLFAIFKNDKIYD